MQVLREKDKKILMNIRGDARRKVTEIAKITRIPLTTIYGKLMAYEKNGIIKRHVSLINFSKIGYETKVHLAIKVKKENRNELQKFLNEQPNINSLYATGYDCDMLCEGVFKNIPECEKFIERIENDFGAEEIKRYHIIQELKKEDFLSKPEHFELV